jgi:hypothetical protein
MNSILNQLSLYFPSITSMYNKLSNLLMYSKVICNGVLAFSRMLQSFTRNIKPNKKEQKPKTNKQLIIIRQNKQFKKKKSKTYPNSLLKYIKLQLPLRQDHLQSTLYIHTSFYPSIMYFLHCYNSHHYHTVSKLTPIILHFYLNTIREKFNQHIYYTFVYHNHTWQIVSIIYQSKLNNLSHYHLFDLISTNFCVYTNVKTLNYHSTRRFLTQLTSSVYTMVKTPDYRTSDFLLQLFSSVYTDVKTPNCRTSVFLPQLLFFSCYVQIMITVPLLINPE